MDHPVEVVPGERDDGLDEVGVGRDECVQVGGVQVGVDDPRQVGSRAGAAEHGGVGLQDVVDAVGVQPGQGAVEEFRRVGVGLEAASVVVDHRAARRDDPVEPGLGDVGVDLRERPSGAEEHLVTVRAGCAHGVRSARWHLVAHHVRAVDIEEHRFAHGTSVAAESFKRKGRRVWPTLAPCPWKLQR